MNREFFRPQHLAALLLATLMVWAFREFSTQLVGILQPATLKDLWANLPRSSHVARFVFAVVIVVWISAAQELGSSRMTVRRAVGIGGLIGGGGLVVHSTEGIPPELRDADIIRALVMGVGYIIASLIVFAGKRSTRQAAVRAARD